MATAAAMLFSQDIYYVNRNEVLYNGYEPFGPSSVLSEVHEGETIDIITPFVGTDTDNISRVEIKKEDGKTGWLAANAISVVNSELLPDEITNNRWTHSYYLDVLQSGNRETLFTYEPFWRDDFYKYKDMDAMYPGNETAWYERAQYESGLYFTTIYSRIWDLSGVNHFDLINGKISKNDGIFSFSNVCISRNIVYKQNDLENIFLPGEKVAMALSLDGDYLDVFVNNRKIFTLIKYDEDIFYQFQNLMLNKICDLTHVAWPCRADGSMDYPLIVSNSTPIRQAIEPAEIISDNENNTKAIPMPLLLAIIGGVVFVSGGLVFFIINRKK
jgi:hypothetical protein